MLARRWRGYLGIVVVLVVSGACGDGDADPIGPPPDPCSPQLPANWAPRWRPPASPDSGACTLAQIDLEYASCEGPSATSARCSAFRNDVANVACVACLFSDEGAALYGPIIRTADVWRSNTAGCIALVDGDSTPAGCGARVQASSSCYDAACDGCAPVEAYVACRQKAAENPCRQYYLDAVCLLRPEYARCTEYASNREFFVAAATLFCSSGSAMKALRAVRGVE